MEITKEQLQAAEQGEPVRLQTDDVELVVVRADVFDGLAGVLDHPRETYSAVLKALDQADEDPGQYLEYLNESR